MTVFVTGATGVLGGRIVGELANRGHAVLGLARDDEGETIVERRGGRPVRGDVLDAASIREAVGDESVDAVVHAATKLPSQTKTDAAYWERNDRVRLEGARNLLDVLGDRIEQFVFPSVVWVARQPDGSRFDETAERHPDRATQSAADTEDFLREAGGERNFAVSILRLGLLYGPDGGHTRTFAENLLAGDLPILGRGLLGRRDTELSLVHADDAAGAVATAVDDRVAGLYHVVDDEPVTTADYLETFADRLDAPEPNRIPWWVARPMAGKDTVRFMTSPFPTTNDRFKAETDWEPTYRSYREGLGQIVEAWKADGTLAELRDEPAREATNAAGGSPA